MRISTVAPAQRSNDMSAVRYDAWYDTPRGAWIGNAEFRLLGDMLAPSPGESLLDIGCGTGYFARRFAREAALRVTGVDPNQSWLAFARTHATRDETYVAGRAESLSFADRSFDYSVSVAALCFIVEQRQALRELLRVTRKRFAIGVLNRHSLLYLQKGRGGGSGSYRGARWQARAELAQLFDGLPVEGLVYRCAVFLPGGGRIARILEDCLPRSWTLGAMLAVAGNACPVRHDRPAVR